MNRGTRPDAAIRDAYVATLTRYAMLQWSKKKKNIKLHIKHSVYDQNGVILSDAITTNTHFDYFTKEAYGPVNAIKNEHVR